MSDDYVSDLRAFCAKWLKQNQGCDLIDHGFGTEHGDELTTVKLDAALDELEKLRAERMKARTALAVAAELIDRLAEDDECDYDRNDCCQSHHVDPRPCPHPLGRQFVEAWRAVEAEQQPENDAGEPA